MDGWMDEKIYICQIMRFWTSLSPLE